MSVEAPYFAHYAPALLAKGWGVFPATCGKATDIAWREFQRRQPRLLEMMRWVDELPASAVALPFGPVNDDVIGLDVDEDDPVQAAGTGEAIREILGESPIVRVGRWPRTLHLYRAPRTRSQIIGPIQVLARGHYGVLYGCHPLTREPYRHVGKGDLLQIRPRDLPVIGRRALEQLRAELDRGKPRTSAVRSTIGSTGMSLAEALRGVELGRRHNAMLCIASAFRGRADTRDAAETAVISAALRCTPPYSVAEALDVVRWVCAKFPAGSSQLQTGDGPMVLRVAVRRAREQPYHLDGASELYKRFLAACADLQRFCDTKPIALPQPALASLLGCSSQGVGKLIARAIAGGLLQPVCTTYQIGERAKTYRFVGDCGGGVSLT